MNPPDGAERPDPGLLLGKLALERRYVTPVQLQQALARQALEVQQGRPAPPKLGNLLLQMGFLNERQLAELLEIQQGRLRPPPGPKTPPPPAAPAPHPVPAFGRYRILREIGRGGMGVVYEAMDTELDRKVALKMLLSSPGEGSPSTPPEEERFLREARLSARLSKHPHIVGVYEAGRVGPRSFIAMEFIEGRNLSEWRKAARPSLRLQVRVLRDTALAVHHAHKAGIVHRDLKPANVLVDARNEPHVTDFGLAKSLRGDGGASLTVSGAIMGTPAYMSPEQAQGKKEVDRRTDVYSLGVMLYEILTGRTPFRGNSPVDIITKIIRDPVPAPSGLPRTASTPPPDLVLEKICLKALEKKRTDRYGSAQAFADDLTRWLEGREVSIEPPRPDRTRMFIAAGAAAALLPVLLYLLLRPSTDSPNDLLRRAHEWMKFPNYQEAWDGYHRVLQKDPSNAAAREGKALAEEKWLDLLEARSRRQADRGLFAEAEANFEPFLARIPDHPRAKSLLAGIRDRRLDAVVLEAERLLAEGNLWEATVRLTRVLDENPSHRKGLELMGKLRTAAAPGKVPEKPVPPPRPGPEPPAPPTPPASTPPPVAPPPPAPTDAPPADPSVVEIIFGPELHERGIHMRTPPNSNHEFKIEGGKPCIRAFKQRLHFDVDDDWAKDLEAVEAEVEFYDLPGVHWELQYDSRDSAAPSEGRHKEAGHSSIGGTQRWKKQMLTLEDPLFRNRQEYLCDFRMYLGGGRPTLLHRIALRKVPGTSRLPADPASSPESAEGWIPIFNGKDLSGWHPIYGTARVEERTLILPGIVEISRPISGGDFELQGRFQIGTHLRIYLRRADKKSDDLTSRLVFHYDGDVHLFDGPSERRARSGPGKFDPKDWYRFLIRLQGGEIRLFLNDRLLLTGPARVSPQGYLSIYVYEGSTACLRDLLWRELTAKPAPATEKP